MYFKFKLIGLLLSIGYLGAQVSTKIRLNQIGFYVNGPKSAAIIGSTATEFSIKSTDRKISYFTGTLSAEKTWAQSGEVVKVADFSSFTQKGNFVVDVPSFGYSYTFSIDDNVLVPLNKGLVKAFYYNRTSTALLKPNAGIWARNAGHPDDKVIVHASAASTQRPAGTVISSPKGWYDAGDYNSYIVNSGISTYSLLLAYEQFNGYYDTLNLNIPESANAMPDILDEIKWNLDWMLTMQDRNDGGVYTKKTNANFDGDIMPEDAMSKRYVVKKSTAAAFDFAAVMAVTYRVYFKWDSVYAKQCLEAAKTAYNWGLLNPNVTFTNPGASTVNSVTYPAVSTGGYGDNNLTDELEWAANELYIATKVDSFYTRGFKNTASYFLPSWPNVRTLGLLSLIQNRKSLTDLALADTARMIAKLTTMANNYSNYQKNTSPYKIVMGQGGNGDFGWGSNGNVANQGMILLNAYLVSNKIDYLNAALSNVDYLMGKNAVNYSFVTGFGDRAVNYVHHRPSMADGIEAAVPGWLAGGPSNASGDGCVNNTQYLALSYEDDATCYTKNEIAINWNAPAAYLTGAYQLYQKLNSGDPNAISDFLLSTKNEEVMVYPSPASNNLSLEFVANVSTQSKIKLTNNVGQTVVIFDKSVVSGNNKMDIDVAQLPKGLYFVNINTESQNFVAKFVKE